MIDWILPLQIVSPNVQEHWTKTHLRNKENAKTIIASWRKLTEAICNPCVVTLERLYNPSYSQKPMDQEENLRMSFKGIKDTIADLIIPGMMPGRADEGHGIQWVFIQTASNAIPIKQYRIYRGKKTVKTWTQVRIKIQSLDEQAREELTQQAQELRMGY